MVARSQLAAGLAGGLALCAATPAAAQVSASVGVVSDYRLRGVTLSNGRAAATLDLSYDHPSGAYAGATVVGENREDSGLRVLGHSEYMGFVGQPVAGGPAVDVGLNNVDFDVYNDGHFGFRYTEVYVGLIQGGLSGHIHYSPNYLQSGNDALYAELTAVARPADNWRLSAHAGLFQRLNAPPGARRTRWDVRLGATREFRNLELNVGWTHAEPRPLRAPNPYGGFQVGATMFF